MSTLLKLPIDEMTGIESFLQDRKTAKDAFNTEFSALKKRMNAAKKENDLKVLFRISLNETIVFLGEQTLSNLFSNIEKEYPVSGLFLREIQIRHNEYLGDTFGYDNSIDINIENLLPVEPYVILRSRDGENWYRHGSGTVTSNGSGTLTFPSNVLSIFAFVLESDLPVCTLTVTPETIGN